MSIIVVSVRRGRIRLASAHITLRTLWDNGVPPAFKIPPRVARRVEMTKARNVIAQGSRMTTTHKQIRRPWVGDSVFPASRKSSESADRSIPATRILASTKCKAYKPLVACALIHTLTSRECPYHEAPPTFAPNDFCLPFFCTVVVLRRQDIRDYYRGLLRIIRTKETVFRPGNQ